MMEKITLKEFCKKYSGRMTAGAAAIGTIAVATVLLSLGFRKKAIEDFGLEEVISEE